MHNFKKLKCFATKGWKKKPVHHMSIKNVHIICDICPMLEVDLYSKSFNNFDNNIEDVYKEIHAIVTY